MITLSEITLTSAADGLTLTASDGRRLTLRRLTALDKLRLFKAAGPALSQNQPWLGMAMLASSVTAIDDVPIPPPTNEPQIEAMVSRLGDSGIAAVAEAFQHLGEAAGADLVVNAGNSRGTPT
jgi:hypothetical protein